MHPENVSFHFRRKYLKKHGIRIAGQTSADLLWSKKPVWCTLFNFIPCFCKNWYRISLLITPHLHFMNIMYVGKMKFKWSLCSLIIIWINEEQLSLQMRCCFLSQLVFFKLFDFWFDANWLFYSISILLAKYFRLLNMLDWNCAVDPTAYKLILHSEMNITPYHLKYFLLV